MQRHEVNHLETDHDNALTTYGTANK